jgi:hypothetical protein
MTRASTARCTAAAAALLLAACTTGTSVELPDRGTVRLTTQATSLAVDVPPAIDGRIRYAGNGLYRFGDPDATPYAQAGSISAEITNPAILDAFKARLAGATDAQILDAYLTAIGPLDKASPGRPTNRLRDYATGDPRPEHTALGIACAERRLRAEDRNVQGQPRRLYLYNALIYTCIDPKSRLPVELTWSERHRAGTHRLSPTFETDAQTFFASLRFL